MFAGVGIGLNITGMIVATSHPLNSLTVDNFARSISSGVRGYLIMLAGLAASVVSVSHFIMAGKNKKRASLMISTNDVPSIINQNLCYSKLPSVKLTIQL